MRTVESDRSPKSKTTLLGLIKFAITGGVTTVAHVVSGLAAHHFLGLDPFTANLVAFFVGFLVGYFGHKTFSFNSPSKIQQSMPRFFLLTIANLVLNQTIVVIVSIWLGYPYWLSLAIMVVTVPMSTYLLSRFWVFRDGEF